MTYTHDYSAHVPIEPDTSSPRLSSHTTLGSAPTPKLALWLSIVAGAMLLIGLIWALAIEFSGPTGSAGSGNEQSEVVGASGILASHE